jgi:hypothetical protein
VERGCNSPRIELAYEMNLNTTNFGKALEGVISARTREATRQIGRNNEFLLIGALTKRPN